MRKLVSGFMIVGALLLSVSALADDAEIKAGGYAFGDFGYSPLTDRNGNSSSGYGFGLGGGYSFNNYLGMEGALNLVGLSASTNITPVSISAAAIGHIPVYRGLNIYLKAGESYNILMTQSSKSTGTGAVTGGGLEFVGNNGVARIGIEHYDLTAGGIPYSTNYINLTFSGF